MKTPLKILILEDSTSDAELVQRLLKKEKLHYEFNVAMSKESFLRALKEFSPDVVLSDNSLPQFNATEALKIVRERSMNIPFILVTGTVSDEFAANIIKSGADDYILKDRLIRLPVAIDTALRQRKAEKEIADYKYALDQSSIISITDQKGIILYVNDNFCKISKYSAEELIGQDHRIINSGYHRASYIRYLWATIANGKIWRGEFRNRAKDSSIYWVDATIVPFLNDKGKPYQYLAIRTDITVRKKAEEDLRQSEMRLNEAQAIAHISNWEIDFVQNSHTWSDEFYRIYGINKDEVQPSLEFFLSFMHPDDANFARKKVQEAFEVFKESSFDFRFIRKDGITRHGYTEWRFELDKSGKPLRLFGILQDNTESKEAEEELKKAKERFQYAIQAASDIIWEFNFETNQYQVYEGKEKFFGTNKKWTWQPGTEGEHIIEEDRARIIKSFDEAKMEPARKLWKEGYRVYSTKNAIRYIVNHAIFIRDGKGSAIRAIGAITDITEQKKLEAELFEQQKKEQLKITATALKAQEKERNAIGAELHDNVNQILVGTKLLLSLVKGDLEKDQALVATSMKYLQDAIEENRKIAHVLVAPDLKEVSLVDELTRLVHDMLKISSIETHIDTSAFREELLDNERKLAVYRIAQEQCTNIVKYARAEKVKITLSTTDNVFEMTISDNGQGMNTEKKTKGIGLNNIKGRLSIFNGVANINTAPGKGFTLEITIPLKK
jgi:PAS domain S-box-containing protein